MKLLGCSKIEVDGNIYEFFVGDSSYIEVRNIFEKLDEIDRRLREEGYKLEVLEVLFEIDDEEKVF